MFNGFVEIMPGDLEELKGMVSGISSAIKSLGPLASSISTDTVASVSETAVNKILYPLLEDFASGELLARYPATASQLVILFGNLIGTAGSNVNTPEVACKMDNILKEYRRRLVNARLEQLQPPVAFADKVSFFEEKINAQNKPYNKDGYNPEGVRCYRGEDQKCFTDNFIKQGKDKQICTTQKVCYGDYAGEVRHKIEAIFPNKLLENVCHSKFVEDPTTGNFIILHMLIKFISKKKITD